MIHIDCHFHTNFWFDFLPTSFHHRKAKKIRAKFMDVGLDAVILTEHVFKKPALSYKTMMENKPVDSRVDLIPGVECLTKEGIDFLVRSEDTYVYTIEKLMTPKLLTLREMIDIVHDDKRLYGSVAHPFVPSDTAISYHYDDSESLEIISLAGVVEKHNFALYSTRVLFEKILPNKFLDKLKKTECLPDKFTDGYAYTGGSDAHTIGGISPFLAMKSGKDTLLASLVDKNIYRKMHKNISDSFFDAILLNIACGLIVMYESLKKRIGFYVIDRTYL